MVVAEQAPSGRLADGTPFYGRLGEIAYDSVEDKVQCHLCGGWFRQVAGSHLTRKASVIAFDASLAVRN